MASAGEPYPASERPSRRPSRRLVVAVSAGLFAAVAATGAVLLSYYFHRIPARYADLEYLDFDVPFGTWNRLAHRWLSWAALLWAFGLVAARVLLVPAGPVASGARGRLARLLPPVVALALAATPFFLTWDRLTAWAVELGRSSERPAAPVLGHEGPFGELAGVEPAVDARSFLVGSALVADVNRRLWLLHGGILPALAVPLLLVELWTRRRIRRARAARASPGGA